MDEKLTSAVYDADQIVSIQLSRVLLPLSTSVSDAKVLTGRQSPLKNVALLFAEIVTANGYEGMGISYALRVGGGGQYAHAREIAGNIIRILSDNISGIWNKLMWAGASVSPRQVRAGTDRQ